AVASLSPHTLSLHDALPICVLLNGNLDIVDRINAIVYRDGSLPLGSRGTATLFLDDVRIATNVRLFEGQRALGTRVSAAVRERRSEEHTSELQSRENLVCRL